MILQSEYNYLIESIRNSNMRQKSKTEISLQIILMYHTGMKINELLFITHSQISDLLLNGDVVIDIPKLRILKNIEMNENFKNDFLLFYKPSDVKYLFGTSRSGDNPLHPNSAIRRINSTLKNYLGDGSTSKDFRVGYINEMIKKGYGPLYISEIMGISESTVSKNIIQSNEKKSFKRDGLKLEEKCEEDDIKLEGIKPTGYSGRKRKEYSGKITLLYYIKIGGLYKIGLTRIGINARYSKELSNGLNIERVKVWLFEDGGLAYDKEQEIINKYKAHAYRGKNILYGGNSELFNKDVLELD